jgi:hypothetical protein
MQSEFEQLLGVVRDEVPRAANDDGLQVLGTHDGAQPSSAGLSVVAVDTGHVRQFLSCDADASHLDVPAVSLLQCFWNDSCVLPPKVGGVVDFDLVILDEYVRGSVCLPRDLERIVPSVPQLWTYRSTHYALDQSVRRRSFCSERNLASGADRETVEGPASDG